MGKAKLKAEGKEPSESEVASFIKTLSPTKTGERRRPRQTTRRTARRSENQALQTHGEQSGASLFALRLRGVAQSLRRDQGFSTATSNQWQCTHNWINSRQVAKPNIHSHSDLRYRTRMRASPSKVGKHLPGKNCPISIIAIKVCRCARRKSSRSFLTRFKLDRAPLRPS